MGAGIAGYKAPVHAAARGVPASLALPQSSAAAGQGPGLCAPNSAQMCLKW